MKKEDVRKTVREGYAKVARQDEPCCAPVKSCCCGPAVTEDISKKVGYTDADLQSVPEGANMGLGCGNPVALASLRPGETALDLGSGGGLDCFLAAQKVGPEGRVIGVDMTPEMVEKARENARKSGFGNVEFRLGEIESLPVADGSVDVIISNCVINLSPEKERVFQEAFRVLKSGGRLMVSDLVLLHELPAFVRNSKEAYVACLAGAVLKDQYLQAIAKAGFQGTQVVEETKFPVDCIVSDPTAGAVMDKLNISEEDMKQLGDIIVSIKVGAQKP
jgi:SAM-dependent methyltransferase